MFDTFRRILLKLLFLHLHVQNVYTSTLRAVREWMFITTQWSFLSLLHGARHSREREYVMKWNNRLNSYFLFLQTTYMSLDVQCMLVVLLCMNVIEARFNLWILMCLFVPAANFVFTSYCSCESSCWIFFPSLATTIHGIIPCTL